MPFKGEGMGKKAKKTSKWVARIFTFLHKNEKASEEEAKEAPGPTTGDIVEVSELDTTESPVEEVVSQTEAKYPVNVVVKTESSEHPVADVNILLTGPGVRETKTTDDLGSAEFSVPAGEYTVSTEPVQGYERPKPEYLRVDTERNVTIRIKRKVCEVTVRVTDAKIGVPIPRVSVSIGERRSTTGDEGEAYFSDVLAGEQEIIVEGNSDLYEPVTEEQEIEERTNTLEITLKPKCLLTQQQRTELERMRKTLDDAFENVPGYCDMAIPVYIRSVGLAALDIIEQVSNSPSYFMDSSVQPSDMVNQMSEVADKVCRGITEVLLSERNIDMYAAIEKTTDFAASSFSTLTSQESISIYDDMIMRFISDPKGFFDTGYNETQKKLTMIDEEITEKMREFTTVPVSGIWRISKELLKYADTERESELKKAALIFMADLVLDYTRKMFEVPEIVERLRLKQF